MKKIILYILMLLALISVANPKCVLADDSDNTLTVNFSKSGVSYYDFTMEQMYAFEYLIYKGMLNIDYSNQDTYVFTNSSGKQLIKQYRNDSGLEVFETCEGVNKNDNIVYTLSAEEKQLDLSDGSNEEINMILLVINEYDRIIIDFENKDNSIDYNNIVFQGGIKVKKLPQMYLQMIDYLIYNGDMTSSINGYVNNRNGKSLAVFSNTNLSHFFMNGFDEEEYNLDICEGVTQEDDLIYSITNEDREYIDNMNDWDMTLDGKNNIIVQFSDTVYPADDSTLIIDFRSMESLSNSLRNNREFSYTIFRSKNFELEYIYDFYNASGKEVMKFSGETIFENGIYDLLFYDSTIIIPDDVTNEDNIVFEVPMESIQNTNMTSNVISVQFKKEEKNNLEPSPVEPNGIFTNPKTINNILYCIFIIVMCCSLFIIKKRWFKYK